MTTQHKVIIIDDDKVAVHNWSILLNFIGEEVFNLGYEVAKSFLENVKNKEKILTILIGKSTDSELNQEIVIKLVRSIHKQEPSIPILIRCQSDFISKRFPKPSQPWLISLPDAPDYQTLIRLLEKARQLIGLQPIKTVSRIISEQGTPLFRTLSGDSELISQVRKLMHQVSTRNVNVLLLGEAGTGKEIVARNIHYHSGRGDKEFIAVNCAAEGRQFESHFFGLSGSLKNDGQSAEGYLEKADGGTLFLDKITEVPLELQARLLNFLEGKSFCRLGENKSRQVDIRLVVATNENLKQKVAKGEFREDLYYLLNVFPILIPALRERKEDIPDLLKELITRLEHEGQQVVRLNSNAVESLKQCQWPGNVRELTNLIERLSIMHEGKVIGVKDLPPEYRDSPIDAEPVKVIGNQEESLESLPVFNTSKQQSLKIIAPLTVDNLQHYLWSFEKELLETAIEDSGNIQSLAAQRLNLDENEFENKIRKYNLTPG